MLYLTYQSIYSMKNDKSFHFQNERERVANSHDLSFSSSFSSLFKKITSLISIFFPNLAHRNRSSSSSFIYSLFHLFPSLLKKTACSVRSSRNHDLLGSDKIGKSGREAEGNFQLEEIQPRLPKSKLSYGYSFFYSSLSALFHLFPWRNASEIRSARSLSEAKS